MRGISSRDEALFSAALAQLPAERGAFLAKACGADVDLLAHLVALLAAHESPESLLVPSAVPLAQPSLPPEEKPGDRIDRYKLLQKIGEGGCGVVWMAEQEEPVRRRVALKVIKLGMDTKAVVARFEAERQALAMMDHPSIAKVHDAGATATGRPYFVMELVRGIPITKYCDENHLTPTARLELFIKVCHAIQHAHQKGIIHRDIKPSNILITVNDGLPTPKVIDFGIAKATQGRLTDATMFTAFEQFIGTPVYMSPEQAEMSSLDIDTRSDIYSLGVLLYELLTGKPPFDPKEFARAGVEEIRHHIRTDEPLRPSVRLRTMGESERTTLARQRGTAPAQLSILLKGDLDWIVMRCIEKDRTRRYDTANGLAMDIQRHLRHEPVTARPPSSLYLLEKLIRRHRMSFAAGSLVLAAVVIGAIATATQATRALKAERLEHELREAARQAQVKEAALKRAADEEEQRNAKHRWVRQRVLPEINRLIDARKISAAFDEASEAEKYLPEDPALVAIWPRISVLASYVTSPPGAEVYVKPYLNPDAEWRLLGQTPLKGVRVPNGLGRLLIKKDGYVPLERAGMPSEKMEFELDPSDAVPPGMVRIPARTATQKTTALETYFIDRYEVTNRQFKEFVDRGGYTKTEWWKMPFVRDGRELTWAEAIATFRDSTGEPGPATWTKGSYPENEGDHPVGGISWFEAAAYAEFAGKRLPSYEHWIRAAGGGAGITQPLVQMSNFRGQGAMPVGKSGGLSQLGAFDMAGNVREWCWNEADPGRRYILGGSSREPPYMFIERDAQSPFDRSPENGFRCIQLGSNAPLAREVDDPVVPRPPSFTSRQPVSDEIFQAFRNVYSYQKTPLDSRLESVDDSVELWRKERVSFGAAYGTERVPVFVFLPRTGMPPFQTVVFFPGTGGFTQRDRLARSDFCEFIIKSGRALIFPIYQGTYERGEGGRENYIDAANVYPDLVVQWSKDLGRTIDYLETRKDIQSDKLAFLGFSLGGAMGALLPALEPRLKASVLVSGGINPRMKAPQVDAVNFLPRVTLPTLMLNGRFDFIFNGQSQAQMFRLLGTPAEHKRHIVFESGHVLEIDDIERETLVWLDRYLGPVK